MSDNEVFVIEYSVRGGFVGFTELEVKYNSKTREMYTYRRPDVTNILLDQPDEIAISNPKITRILTQQEESSLKTKIIESGFLESTDKPKGDAGATEGMTTFLTIVIGPLTRSVSWYLGMSGHIIVPEPVKTAIRAIMDAAFSERSQR